MELPTPLKTAVESGTAVLLLGSGASLASQDSNGKRPPNKPELAKLLCDNFLSPGYENTRSK